MIQRYRLSMQYLGTKYCGWSKHKNNQNSIQQLLENTFFQFTRENIIVHGSSRTDVHALFNTAHVDLKRWNPHIKEFVEPYEEEELLKIVNALLNRTDVSITSVKKVPDTYHVKYSFERTYVYRIVFSKYSIPFLKDRVYIKHPKNYNIELMREAAKKFVGTHDFYSFSTLKYHSGYLQETIREMTSIEITEHNIENEFSYPNPLVELRFKIVAPRFLYHQIRIIVAFLLKVGFGEIDPKTTDTILKTKCNETRKCLVPPEGLYLTEVKDGY